MARTLKSKRGGGFFNFFKRKKVAPDPSLAAAPKKKSFFNRFTRKRGNKWETVNPPVAKPTVATGPKKSIFTRKRGNKWETVNPASVIPQTPNTPVKQYESTVAGLERGMSFAFQKLDGGQVDPNKIYLSPEEKKTLQVRFLSAIRQVGYDTNKLSDMLFGEPLSQFDEELREWEHSHPNPLITPFPSSGSLNRLIGQILKTDRERMYSTNIEFQQCLPNNKGNRWHSLSEKTLYTDTCTVITNTPEALSEAMSIGDTFYIVVNPKFWSNSISRYDSNYYNSETNRFATIHTKYILVNSSIQDAFLNKGLMLIEPRLGFLFQKEAPELWNRHYWLPKFSNDPKLLRNYNDQSNIRNNNGSRMYLNEAIVNNVRKSDDVKDTLRIVLLTLQKYSALRRFAFTKDPDVCSQIYSEYYVNNAAELLRPNVDLPQVGYNFNREEFDKEFADNQRWAHSKGIALFKSYDDPRLHVFFRTNPAKLANFAPSWFKMRYRKDVMQVPIEPLPNVEAMVNRANAFSPNQAVPYTNMNQLHNLLPTMNASHNIHPSTVRYR